MAARRLLSRLPATRSLLCSNGSLRLQASRCSSTQTTNDATRYGKHTRTPSRSRRMGKNNKSKQVAPESSLVFDRPLLADDESPPVEVWDTHTHILSTYSSYTSKYAPNHQHQSLPDFVRNIVSAQGVAGVVDVWCEAPMMTSAFLDVVDSLTPLKDEGFSYRFVVGVHPHNARNYDSATETAVTKAHKHPSCVGWGEMGLDYHYDNSPREIQKQVFRRQIRSALASGLDKAMTIHTREADDDCWEILSQECPKEQRLHIHCYTDSPEFATKLLEHFPNLFIGITGVATYSSNLNTTAVLRNMAPSATIPHPPFPSPSHGLSTNTNTNTNLDSKRSGLRIVLETDAPFMIPSSLQKGKRLPLCHSAMLPATAEYVAQVLNEGKGFEEARWSAKDVLRVSRENARLLYGV